MILNHSKLGGEASPSLRWLRLCRRPLPSTHPDCYFSPLSVTFHAQNQARKLTSKKQACVGHRADQKAKCEQTWLPKRLQDRAQNHQKNCSWRLRVKNKPCENINFYSLKHTLDASWTQQFPLKSRFGTLRETLSKKD